MTKDQKARALRILREAIRANEAALLVANRHVPKCPECNTRVDCVRCRLDKDPGQCPRHESGNPFAYATYARLILPQLREALQHTLKNGPLLYKGQS